MAVIKHIFFDMDGFLVDIKHAFREIFDLPDDWQNSIYDFYPQIGITKEQFYKAFDLQPVSFWEGLPQIEKGVRLLKKSISFGYKSHILSTSPFKESFNGKFAWVKKHIPEMKKRTILVGSDEEKLLLAGPGRLLFDDYGQNIISWHSNGGEGLLLKTLDSTNEYSHLNPVSFEGMERFIEQNKPR
jgi:hypothetical protein